MSHDAFTEKLLDLAYGELSPREARKVEAHAASCEACRGEIAHIRETRRVMAGLPQEPAPERGERILLAAAREAAALRAQGQPDEAAPERAGAWGARPHRAPQQEGRFPPWLWGASVVAASLVAVAAVSYRIVAMRPGPLQRGDNEALLGDSPYAARAPSPQATIEPRPEPDRPVGGGGTAPGDRPGAQPPVVTFSERKQLGSPREERPSRAFAAPPPLAAPAEPAAPSARPSPSPLPLSPGNPLTHGMEEGIKGEGGPAREGTEAMAVDPRGASEDAARAPRPEAEPRRADEPSRMTTREEAPSGATASRGGPPAPSAAQPAPARAPGRRAKGVEALEEAERHTALSAPGPLVRTFERCAGESRRIVETDPQGRVVRYVREGTIARRRVRIDHVFRPDGALDAASVQDLDAGGAALDARALGIVLPARAEEAGIDAPPRCNR